MNFSCAHATFQKIAFYLSSVMINVRLQTCNVYNFLGQSLNRYCSLFLLANDMLLSMKLREHTKKKVLCLYVAAFPSCTMTIWLCGILYAHYC